MNQSTEATSSDSSPAPLPLAVSCGDPNGIGADIILKAWLERFNLGLPAFYVAGDPEHLKARAALLGLDVPCRSGQPSDALEIFQSALPISALSSSFVNNPGIPMAANAEGVIEAIETCVTDAFERRAAAVVTAPISKKPLYDAGFEHPGHTEYLSSLTEAKTGQASKPVMMLVGPQLRTIPVTIHIALEDVPSALTTKMIVETAQVADRELKTRFGIATPRLAISGLNPHAGEEGSMGRQDIEVIKPAIEALKQQGLNAWGPMPADTMFHAAARETYDVAICMYHDQALIPAKALGFDDAVNVTLGLPFIRTSPDHGTAFDIAGSSKAKPDSFIAALKLAHHMAQNG